MKAFEHFDRHVQSKLCAASFYCWICPHKLPEYNVKRSFTVSAFRYSVFQSPLLQTRWASVIACGLFAVMTKATVYYPDSAWCETPCALDLRTVSRCFKDGRYFCFKIPAVLAKAVTVFITAYDCHFFSKRGNTYPFIVYRVSGESRYVIPIHRICRLSD